MRKNIGVFGLCLMLTIASPISVVANTETMLSPEEELEQLLEVNESQYHLETRGQAELISPGHELLDGKYDNGELVNGSVYYSVEDALAGVKRDKLEAKSICRAEERVSPPTGTIKGPDDKGYFSFTIHDKGRTYSFTTGKTSTWVDTQSQIYRNLSGGTYLQSTDYSYIVTLMDSNGNACGSFLAYPNNISGGLNFNTERNGTYYIKLEAQNFPLNWYLNGDGNVDK